MCQILHVLCAKARGRAFGVLFAGLGSGRHAKSAYVLQSTEGRNFLASNSHLKVLLFFAKTEF